MGSRNRYLAGKVTWVTGSSRGIGRVVAAHLASLGAAVAVHGTTPLSTQAFNEADSLEAVAQAMSKSIRQIVNTIKMAIEETPPELLADVMRNGISLVGGGSLLNGLDVLIAKETKMPTKIIEDPVTAVARGAGLVLENLNELREVLAEPEYLEPPK